LSAQTGQSSGDPRQIQCHCVPSRRAEERAQEEGQTEAQWQEDQNQLAAGRSQVDEKAVVIVYGESGVKIRYCMRDLTWRPVGRLVRFVVDIQPGAKIRNLRQNSIPILPHRSVDYARDGTVEKESLTGAYDKQKFYR
jgi:hypothetical protein